MNAIIDQHLSQIMALCATYRVRRLEVFGSAVRDDFDLARSDIDFLVEFEPGPRAGFSDRYFLLRRELATLLGRRIDLVEDGAVRNPVVAAAIERERVPVYAAA